MPSAPRRSPSSRRGECIDRADNLIFAGPIGTGKTHLAIALGVEAARQRRRVLFTRAADVVRLLLEARDARELGRLQRRLHQVDLLVLDELGFVPFDRAGGELLFNLLAERYERRSVIVTTNLAFSEWVKVFGGDEKLTTALLDRLAHHATVIPTKGKSFRMRKKTLQEATTTTSSHQCGLAQEPSKGVGIKPPGGSISDRRSGSVSDQRHQGSSFFGMVASGPSTVAAQIGRRPGTSLGEDISPPRGRPSLASHSRRAIFLRGMLSSARAPP